MPIPTSGPVSFSDINTELQRSSTATLSMGDSELRTLFDDTVGDISISTGRGKSWIIAGSSDYQIQGTYTWKSPARGWNTLIVYVWGGGGGGAAYDTGGRFWRAGISGGFSYFAGAGTVIGYGGNAGQANWGQATTPNQSLGGLAGGGDVNVTGGNGSATTGGWSYNGGAASTTIGIFPGGGGAGRLTGGVYGAGGGGGGYAQKTYTGYSVIAKNTDYTVVVGAGGAGATSGGYAGSRGRVIINWS